MRDYQTKQNIGGLPDTISVTKMGAGEMNSVLAENENAVSKTGQTLAGQSGAGELSNQLSKALYINGISAGVMVDSGSANTYELTPLTGADGLTVPDSYDHMDGGILSFVPNAPATGASTVKIGQTTGSYLTTKKILTPLGNDLTAGALSGDGWQFIRYDSTADSGNGAFILLDFFNQITTVPLTGGGNLVAGRINELQDGGTYELPPADALPENGFVEVELPDRYSAYTPTVIVDNIATETIVNSVGSDTEIIFNAGSKYVRFITDGSTEWRV